MGLPTLVLAEALKNVTFDESYDPFYQEQFHHLLPRIKAAVPRAYHHVVKLWSLEDQEGLQHPLKVQIKEVPSKTLGRWEAGFVEARGSGSQLQQKLVIDIQSYMQHPEEDLNVLVTHEMAHVVLMDVISGSQAASIPPWFNEGLAQSTTREGFDRVKNDIRNLSVSGLKPIVCDLEGPIDEFAHGPFNGGCYPEFYLAVRRLEQKGGRDTIPKIIRGLREGTPLRDLIQSLTHMDRTAFREETAQYTADVLAGVKPIP